VLDLATGGRIRLPGVPRSFRGRQAAPEEVIIDLAKQICDALRHVHSLGIVHRTSSRETCCFREQVSSRLRDSHSRGNDGVTLTGMPVGTPNYMAPEQILGSRWTTDRLYSLGCALYEFATGRPPYDAEMPSPPPFTTSRRRRGHQGAEPAHLPRPGQHHPEAPPEGSRRRYQSARTSSGTSRAPAKTRRARRSSLARRFAGGDAGRNAEQAEEAVPAPPRPHRDRFGRPPGGDGASSSSPRPITGTGRWRPGPGSRVRLAIHEVAGGLEASQRAHRKDRENASVQSFMSRIASQGALTIRTQPEGLEMEIFPTTKPRGR